MPAMCFAITPVPFFGKGVTTVLVAKQCTSVGLYVLN
jgi:hypothetical protein